MADLRTERQYYLASLSPHDAGVFVHKMTKSQRAAMPTNWPYHAHEGQIPPGGDWTVWLLMAGRGFGKTRAGAEWVRSIAERDGTARIALVAASLAEARAIMVEGDSGLLRIARKRYRPTFESSRNLLRWPTGAQAQLFSAGEPESLRGPQHSHAWCDELAKWNEASRRAQTCWDNLQLGLRLGSDPRIMVTTTPRAVPLVRRLVDQADVAVTSGKTEENRRNLSKAFLGTVRRQFTGTSLARQELDGELLEEVEGALWSRSLLESCRRNAPDEPITRIVIGVDPPVSATGDACGIVVAGVCESGSATILADCTVERASPERWARAVATAAEVWSADRVIAEANQGGAMVASVLRAADISLPVKLVHASRGKVARAEPVAALYEARRVRHAGMFAALEDQLCGLMTGGNYEGPGTSPDRADALVWALTELMLGRRGNPRVLQV